MYVTGDLIAITAIRDKDNAERGLPYMGRPIGGGRHVNTDPLDPLSPGWTLERFPIEQSSIDPDKYGFEFDDHFATVTAPQLTGIALTRIQAATPTRPLEFAEAKPVKVLPGLVEANVTDLRAK